MPSFRFDESFFYAAGAIGGLEAKRRHGSALARDAQQLFGRGDAGLDPAPPVVGERAEAALHGELAQAMLALARVHGGAQGLVDLEQLVDAGAAVIARLQALRAAGAFAIRAELAHQPLGED